MQGMKTRENHYSHLGFMAALSYVAMFVLMYAMVNSLSNVYSNLNQAYMAGLMTAAMVLIELVVMRAMYTDMKLNAVIGGVSLIAGAVCFIFIQRQAAISDTQFLRSMVPHHAAAILMCEKAPVTDPEIKELCRGIVANQQAEIDQMKRRLGQLNGR